LEIIKLNIDQIQPRKYSIKHKHNITYKKILKSLKLHKQVQPIQVLKQNEKYMLIDGFYVLKALKELKVDFVYCIVHENLSKIECMSLYNSLSTTFDINEYQLSKMFNYMFKQIQEKMFKIVCDCKYESKIIINMIKFDYKNFFNQRTNNNKIF